MLTSHILMIRPLRFGYNAETAVNNAFQKASSGDTQTAALQQFDAFVEKLRGCGITVTVLDDTPEPHTPDSIFPNNWISFHRDKMVILYPMFATNRRLERKALDTIKREFKIRQVVDFTHYENENKFLEGTGSMVFDRANHIAYACKSVRTDEKVLAEFCKTTDYTPALFHAVDSNGQAIYHTNVMMCVADNYVVICLDSVRDASEQQQLRDLFAKTKKEVITISIEQMNCFAGNMLQVENRAGQPFLVMSETAYRSLTPEQITALKTYNDIIYSDIHTIETNGGGSARCMMAEVF